MQKKKKIQKNKDLREGVRSKTEETHQQRLELMIGSAKHLGQTGQTPNEVVVKNNGSFKINDHLQWAEDLLAKGVTVTIRGDTKSSEKTVRLVELIKEKCGVREGRVKGTIDSTCHLIFTIN